MNPDTDVEAVMASVRNGASGWLDEHVVPAADADQLFNYIRAALDWDHAAVVTDV